MKIIVINTDYDAFLSQLYKDEKCKTLDFHSQVNLRNASLFGVADYYSYNLRIAGHEAMELHANNEYIQLAWAKEFSQNRTASEIKQSAFVDKLQLIRKKVAQTGLRKLKVLAKPFLSLMDNRHQWLFNILLEQIDYYKPDVVINQSLDGIPSGVIKAIKPKVKLLVGQIAAPIPSGLDLSIYDLMLSSLPNYIQLFKSKGLKAELHPFAFDKRVLDKIDIVDRNIAFSFAGSISVHHKNRNAYLLPLVEKANLQLWGQGVDEFPTNSSLRKVHQGPVFGRDLLQILGRSMMTFNHHIGIAQNYCNNMRMFEATGMGATLITDRKDNLGDYFEVDKEVIVYGSLDECLEKCKYLRENPQVCREIGQAGQKRVLKSHNYQDRMMELSETLKKYL